MNNSRVRILCVNVCSSLQYSCMLGKYRMVDMSEISKREKKCAKKKWKKVENSPLLIKTEVNANEKICAARISLSNLRASIIQLVPWCVKRNWSSIARRNRYEVGRMQRISLSQTSLYPVADALRPPLRPRCYFVLAHPSSPVLNDPD